MNATILVACIIALIALSFLFLVLKKRSGNERAKLNPHRSKLALIKKTRRELSDEKWKIKPGTMVAGRQVDLFLESKLLNVDIICIDRTLLDFYSETRILEQLEESSRMFRIRNRFMVVVYDNGFQASFVRSALNRGLVMLHMNDLESLKRLADYADKLPDHLNDIQSRLLENSYSACVDFSYRFKKAKDNERAIEWARRAVKSRFGYSAHYLLFSLLLDANDLDGAEQIGQEGLSYKPKESSLFFEGFQKLSTLRCDHTAALQWAERWVAADPTDPRAHVNLANLYKKQNNSPAALVAIAEALKRLPTDPEILREGARLAALNDDLKLALTYAETLMAQTPQDTRAHDLMGDLLIKKEDYVKAEVTLVTALTINPDNPSLVRKASIVSLRQGKMLHAIEWADRWLTIAPTDPWAYDHLSMLHLNNRNYEKAQAANNKAVELDPTNPNFLRRAQQINAKQLGAS